jgi:hypothetical protein
MESCDAAQQNCPAGQGCYLSADGQICADPAPGAGGIGAPCECANCCAAGLLCAGASAADSACHAVCTTDGEITCDAGNCASLTGVEPLGICVE